MCVCVCPTAYIHTYTFKSEGGGGMSVMRGSSARVRYVKEGGQGSRMSCWSGMYSGRQNAGRQAVRIRGGGGGMMYDTYG